jgi:hypothetical protein
VFEIFGVSKQLTRDLTISSSSSSFDSSSSLILLQPLSLILVYFLSTVVDEVTGVLSFFQSFSHSSFSNFSSDLESSQYEEFIFLFKMCYENLKNVVNFQNEFNLHNTDTILGNEKKKRFFFFFLISISFLEGWIK